MQEIIMQAFDLQDYQVLGLPESAKRKWATPNLEYYDIDARNSERKPDDCRTTRDAAIASGGAVSLDVSLGGETTAGVCPCDRERRPEI